MDLPVSLMNDGGNCMEKENFKKYMLYGLDGKTPFDQCIKNEIVVILLSVLLIYIGIMQSIIFLILGLVPVLAYLIFIIKLKSANKKLYGNDQVIEGVYYILNMGIYSVCLSYIFALAGIEIIYDIFNEKERITAISIIIAGYIIVIFLYKCMIRKLIERNAYGGSTKKLKGGLFFALFGVLGMSTGRILVNVVDYKSAGEIGSIIFLFLSYLCLIGIFNITKYKYLMEHKELWDKGKDKK